MDLDCRAESGVRPVAVAPMAEFGWGEPRHPHQAGGEPGVELVERRMLRKKHEHVPNDAEVVGRSELHIKGGHALRNRFEKSGDHALGRAVDAEVRRNRDVHRPTRTVNLRWHGTGGPDDHEKSPLGSHSGSVAESRRGPTGRRCSASGGAEFASDSRFPYENGARVADRMFGSPGYGLAYGHFGKRARSFVRRRKIDRRSDKLCW